MGTIMKKKYLQRTILFAACITFVYSTTMLSCPTCIGYPVDNKPPFFEKQENKTRNDESTDNQTEHITASVTNDSQEDNS